MNIYIKLKFLINLGFEVKVKIFFPIIPCILSLKNPDIVINKTIMGSKLCSFKNQIIVKTKANIFNILYILLFFNIF